MNIYKTTFSVECPNKPDEWIEYALEIESEDIIMVEHINDRTDVVGAMFHENLADLLYAQIGGNQTMTATHQGVEIKTIRPGRQDTWQEKLLSALNANDRAELDRIIDRWFK